MRVLMFTAVMLSLLVCGPVLAGERTVVILLFDGFAPALLQRAATPNLDRLRREGAWTHDLQPVFPSISLPNQVSISTGCWPERHGIVSNIFLDPERGKYDHSDDADWLTGCEHLHETAERQGIRAGALGWVGRFSETDGELASLVSTERKYADFPDDNQRAAQVVQALRMPDKQRPRLLLAYFKGPDDAQHFSGMDSARTRQAVMDADAQIGQILDAITRLPFRDAVTLMVTTDHGMVPASYAVNVKKILLNHEINARFVSSGTTSFLYFDDPRHLEHALSQLISYRQFTVTRRQLAPHWHLGSSDRVGGLIISARPPYFIEDIDRWPWWLRWLGTFGPEFMWAGFSLKATHGYPDDVPGVQGLLYAWGAGIAKGKQLKRLRAIDIHPTAAKLLGIQPGDPIDGQIATEMLAP